MHRKTLSVILSICVVLSVVLATPIVASAETQGSLKYSVSGGNATVTGHNGELNGELIIPETLGGYPVTAIGSSAFSGCTGLISITIGSSVTSIGKYAFSGCTGVTQINYNAKSVADLTSSSNVFYYAGTNGDGIDIIFGDSVEKIPAYLFYIDDYSVKDYSYVPKIKSITMGNSVESIGSYAFRDCNELNVINIPNSVKSIGSYAFYGCSGISSLTIGSGVTSIGQRAFSGCTRITEINYNAKSVGDFSSSSEIFYNVGLISEKLKVFFGDSVEKIPSNLFNNCSKITSVKVGSNTTSIGSYAFKGCNKLNSINIPKGITNIGNSAFSDCYRLVEVKNDSTLNITKGSNSYGYVGYYAIEVHNENESKIIDKDGFLFYTYNNVNYLLGRNDNETSFDLPENYNGESYQIYHYAFEKSFNDYTGLTSIEIPDSVTSIGDHAFSYCTGIVSISIGNNVTSIGEYAFVGCSKLKSIEIPDSVKEIKSNAFAYSIKLKSVIIGNGVESIGTSAFYNCGLTNITIGNSVTNIGDSAFFGCERLTSIEIPKKVMNIGENAFYACGFTNITVDVGNTVYYSKDNCLIKTNSKQLILGSNSSIIPEDGSVTSIGEGAFSNCKELKSIIIPDSVKSIGDYAFYQCTGLTSVKTGNGVISIGEGAFSECKGLVSFAIGEKVTSIGRINCNGGKIVEIINYSSLNITKDSNPYDSIAYNALEIHNGDESKVVNKNGYLFYTYDNVNYLLGYTGDETSLILPKDYNGENYQIYKNAFYGNDKIINVTIPDCVTSIGESAFDYCTKLASVKIGDGVTNIKSYAFSYCTGLTSVTIGNGLTSISRYAFENCYKLVEVINHSSFSITEIKNSNSNLGYYALEIHNENESKIFNKNGYLFYTYNNVNYLLGYIGENETSLTLPKDYNGENYEIYNYAFLEEDSFWVGNNRITEVTIPTSVTSIGDFAFSGCSELEIVYYDGTQDDKVKINIKNYNDYLLNAEWVYLREHTTHIYDDENDGVCNICGEFRDFGSELLSIDVLAKPKTITYFIGKTFDPDGMILSARFANGFYKIVQTDYILSGIDTNTVGKKAVTVSWCGKTTEFDVDIIAPNAESLANLVVILLVGPKGHLSYDLNENGVVDLLDFVQMKKMMSTSNL